MPIEILVPLAVLSFLAPPLVAFIAVVKAQAQVKKQVLSTNGGIVAGIAYVLALTLFVSIGIATDTQLTPSQSDGFGAYWVLGGLIAFGSGLGVLSAAIGDD